MKDARGHGSEGRGGYRPNDPMPMRHSGIGFGVNGPGFSGKILGTMNGASDTQRTVAMLRNSLQTASPGHASSLTQGIKNLLGMS